MRKKSRWRELLLCFVLQGGVVFGVPMPPDEIRRLMQSLSAPVAARVLPADEDPGGGEPPPADP
ncbi:MAG: hypothetical protein ABW221_18490 [Vicinamibacteria bacterium]